MNEPLSKTILLVEDNEDDVFIVQRVLKRARIANPLRVVTDGEDAIEYLSGKGEFSDRDKFPLPFLVFLDLKLPYLDGFEVLSWIRQQPGLSDLAVVVLTSSGETRDFERAYALGARSYLVKPPNAQALQEVLKSLESFWLRQAESLPVSLQE